MIKQVIQFCILCISEKFEMTKKQQLYYLLESFIDGRYDVQTFCHAFEDVFYPEIPKDELTAFELLKFNTLGDAVVRFSPFSEDIKAYPGTYYTEIEIENAIKSTYFELSKTARVGANRDVPVFAHF